MDPLLYNFSDTPNPFRPKLTAFEIWNNDIIRLRNIINIGFIPLVIWESEILKDKNLYIDKCLNFIDNTIKVYNEII